MYGKLPRLSCFEDADNVKARIAGATALVVSAVSVVVVVLLSWKRGGWVLLFLPSLKGASTSANQIFQEFTYASLQAFNWDFQSQTPSFRATLLDIQKHDA